MMRQWVEFKGRPNVKGANEVRVTLNKKGVFLLNKKALEMLGEPEAVKLFFDERNQSIGLGKATAEYENAFPVKSKDKYNNRTVCASPFCRHNKVRVDSTIAFNNIEIDHDGIMALELHKATVIGK